ncbi:flagellar basal body P-ring protein FlgI, partial [Sandarakinorhabdus rubra]|uniref:flagellar basal body P-ring protein FlgI n=1 Tax=Sandarakinorhabdus rubra TaxID=2672568 RepID=UPI001969A5F8
MRWLLALLLLLAAPASAERVKDIARFAGVRANALTGYGIVVGLTGSGDQNLEFTIQSLKSATARLGVLLPPGVNPQLRNAAAVMVTAELPAFAKPGQRLDVTVAALGQAKSLRGGTLLLTALQGADGEIYALAQGSLAVGGFGAEGRDGSRIVVGTPATGRVPAGAIVERAVPSPFANSGPLWLDLNDPDFSAARAVADAITTTLGGDASAEDGTRIRISAPDDVAARIALAA